MKPNTAKFALTIPREWYIFIYQRDAVTRKGGAMQPLTPKQAEILSFIEDYHSRYSQSPTYQEIQHRFGFASPHAATKHVQALIRKGYVSTRKTGTKNSPRCLQSLRPSGKEVPLVGEIAAGIPIEAIENIETRLDLSTLGIDNSGGEYFALRVKGESMINAHILDGDLVVVKRRPEVGRNEIAAVLWNGEATLKYVLKSRGTVLLIPANDAMRPITITADQTESFEILGKVVRVIRSC